MKRRPEDIDLGIFAQSAERVAEYERQIRAEYTWVTEAIYREKRGEMLRGFLERERIYRTEFFHRRNEATARCHLALLIEQTERAIGPTFSPTTSA